mmetsp:Transcript_24067/g.80890  ORF Transcript_24067/g.80890 Transcript_24067/m.80890 type:complete len:202 (+) Transcript_24067:362-967(+)
MAWLRDEEHGMRAGPGEGRPRGHGHGVSSPGRPARRRPGRGHGSMEVAHAGGAARPQISRLSTSAGSTSMSETSKPSSIMSATSSASGSSSAAVEAVVGAGGGKAPGDGGPEARASALKLWLRWHSRGGLCAGCHGSFMKGPGAPAAAGGPAGNPIGGGSKDGSKGMALPVKAASRPGMMFWVSSTSLRQRWRRFWNQTCT